MRSYGSPLTACGGRGFRRQPHRAARGRLSFHAVPQSGGVRDVYKNLTQTWEAVHSQSSGRV
jgi:hypothetical protein